MNQQQQQQSNFSGNTLSPFAFLPALLPPGTAFQLIPVRSNAAQQMAIINNSTPTESQQAVVTSNINVVDGTQNFIGTAINLTNPATLFATTTTAGAIGGLGSDGSTIGVNNEHNKNNNTKTIISVATTTQPPANAGLILDNQLINPTGTSLLLNSSFKKPVPVSTQQQLSNSTQGKGKAEYLLANKPSNTYLHKQFLKNKQQEFKTKYEQQQRSKRFHEEQLKQQLEELERIKQERQKIKKNQERQQEVKLQKLSKHQQQQQQQQQQQPSQEQTNPQGGSLSLPSILRRQLQKPIPKATATSTTTKSQEQQKPFNTKPQYTYANKSLKNTNLQQKQQQSQRQEHQQAQLHHKQLEQKELSNVIQKPLTVETIPKASTVDAGGTQVNITPINNNKPPTTVIYLGSNNSGKVSNSANFLSSSHVDVDGGVQNQSSMNLIESSNRGSSLPLILNNPDSSNNNNTSANKMQTQQQQTNLDHEQYPLLMSLSDEVVISRVPRKQQQQQQQQVSNSTDDSKFLLTQLHQQSNSNTNNNNSNINNNNSCNSNIPPSTTLSIVPSPCRSLLKNSNETTVQSSTSEVDLTKILTDVNASPRRRAKSLNYAAMGLVEDAQRKTSKEKPNTEVTSTEQRRFSTASDGKLTLAVKCNDDVLNTKTKANIETIELSDKDDSSMDSVKSVTYSENVTESDDNNVVSNCDEAAISKQEDKVLGKKIENECNQAVENKDIVEPQGIVAPNEKNNDIDYKDVDTPNLIDLTIIPSPPRSNKKHTGQVQTKLSTAKSAINESSAQSPHRNMNENSDEDTDDVLFLPVIENLIDLTTDERFDDTPMEINENVNVNKKEKIKAKQKKTVAVKDTKTAVESETIKNLDESATNPDVDDAKSTAVSGDDNENISLYCADEMLSATNSSPNSKLFQSSTSSSSNSNSPKSGSSASLSNIVNTKTKLSQPNFRPTTPAISYLGKHSSSATSKTKSTSLSAFAPPPSKKPRTSLPTASTDAILKAFDMLTWKNGTGFKRGSNIRFSVNELGLVQIQERCPPRTNSKTNFETPIYNRKIKPILSEQPDPLLYLCRQCKFHAAATEFLAPEFCSLTCVRASNKSKSQDIAVQIARREMLKEPLSKLSNLTSSIKMSQVVQPTMKKAINCSSSSTVTNSLSSNASSLHHYQNSSKRKRPSSAFKRTAPAQNYSGKGKNYFNWEKHTQNMPSYNRRHAPIDFFPNPFPIGPNKFKVGMRLEAIDPENCALFCVCNVVEKKGYRLRLNFDGYSSIYDFWVNADSMDIFPVGFCQRSKRTLQPPKGYNEKPFDWSKYLQHKRAVPAPVDLFTHLKGVQSYNPFKIGMHLEADDLNDTRKICVATVADVLDARIRVHFDGWDDCYDYWVHISSPYIHACNWHQGRQAIVKPPHYDGPFSWADYIAQCGDEGIAAFEEMFSTRDPVEFQEGMMLEVVDPRNPSLIRPATVVGTRGHRVKLHLDCFPSEYCFWLEDDSPDLHPVGWCSEVGHELEPPPGYEPIAALAPCNILGCRGLGNVKEQLMETHTTRENCPYAPENWRRKISKNPRIFHSAEAEKIKLSAINAQTKQQQQHQHNQTQVQPQTLRKRRLLKQDLKSAKRTDIKTEQRIPSLVNGSERMQTRRVLQQNPTNIDLAAMTLETFETENTTAVEIKGIKTEKRKESDHEKKDKNRREKEKDTTEPNVLACISKFLCKDYGPCLQRNFKIWQNNFDFDESRIKRSPRVWSVEETANYIADITNQKTADIFREQGVDGAGFLMLNEDDLSDDPRLKLKTGPAAKIYSHIMQLRMMVVNKFGKN